MSCLEIKTNDYKHFIEEIKELRVRDYCHPIQWKGILHSKFRQSSKRTHLSEKKNLIENSPNQIIFAKWICDQMIDRAKPTSVPCSPSFAPAVISKSTKIVILCMQDLWLNWMVYFFVRFRYYRNEKEITHNVC